jgi:hypothetical protein
LPRRSGAKLAGVGRLAATPVVLGVLVARHVDRQTEVFKQIQARTTGDDPPASGLASRVRRWYLRASGQLPAPQQEPPPSIWLP